MLAFIRNAFCMVDVTINMFEQDIVYLVLSLYFALRCII